MIAADTALVTAALIASASTADPAVLAAFASACCASGVDIAAVTASVIAFSCAAACSGVVDVEPGSEIFCTA